MAEIKRYKMPDGRWVYCVYGDYDKEPILVEPKELRKLLRYCQEHDGLDNKVIDEMEGF